MKCLIVAGGSGDSLWPLSRKYYPKQFMNIKEGRSLLQETVVRNMTFCDEFIIITNERYKNIVEGQMKAFQSLRYRILLEGTPRGTAAAVALGCMFCNQSELIFVVSSDNIIGGKGYQTDVLLGKEMAKNGSLVTFGVAPTKPVTNYGYIRHTGQKVTGFVEKPSVEEAKEFIDNRDYMWNTGICLFRAGDFLNELRKNCIEIYRACIVAKRKVFAANTIVTFNKALMETIPAQSIESAIFEKTQKAKVIEIEFEWRDVGTVTDMVDFKNQEDSIGIIENQCNNVSVINRADRQLVVANDLNDVIVVNTEDAVYVSKKESVDNIKDIINNNHGKYEAFFDYNRFSYREWGTHELLSYSDGYRVKKVTVFPGLSMNLHQHEFRSEHWSVVEGVATITLEDDTRDYHKYESVYVPVGMKHKVANNTDENVIIIEVGIGERLVESDMVRIYGNDNKVAKRSKMLPMIKLDPAFKDNLWGGTKLRTVFGKKCDYDIIGESWELSAHPDGQSRIAVGRYKGMLFNEYLNMIGKEAWGWKCQAMDCFPVLIKFIDAMQALSIQIHPDDEYALEVEGEYGKNEMWYVIDCEEGSSLYCGLKQDISKEEIKERVENNTIIDVLNEVKVKKGDVVFVKAGTIHAIGAGILICEIQQNSNSTYRMYDYDRRDKFGNPRELHLEKALDVVDTHAFVKDTSCGQILEENELFSQTLLVQCKYFECFKYDIHDEAKIAVDETSFVSVLFLSGNGTIEADKAHYEFKAGESFFVQAGKRNIVIKGTCECIVTHV